MKGLIVYKGRYSATRQYAKWLSEELRLPAYVSDIANEDDVDNADFVIIGSSVYIGKLQIKKWLLRNAKALSGKKLFFFMVCGTPSDKKEQLQSYIDAAVPLEIRDRVKVFVLPGRMIYKKLSTKDKFMLRMGAMLSRDAKVKKEMLTDYDAVKKENIEPLLRETKAYFNDTVQKNLRKTERAIA